jgi:uncharacterized protein YecE (DUF72 family)
MTPKFYIGTAGWSYKDWIPSFYPKSQTAKFDWLRFYSIFFNCVEVNSAYYTYLSPKIAEGWIEKTAERDDFTFAVKLHQDFTHNRKFGAENVAAVKSVLKPLAEAGRLGPVLIQFPYSFQFTGASAEYITRLSAAFEEFDKTVEVRHSSWMREEACAMFNQAGITFCSIDQPQIGKAVKFQPVVTSDKLYIRFHGRNKEAWIKSINSFGQAQPAGESNERYRYLYSPGELVEIQQIINRLREKVKEIYIIMNNHPGGNAVANAFELIHYLEERGKIKIPETTLNAFPRLKAAAMN